MNVDLKSVNQAQNKKLPKSGVSDMSITSVPSLPGGRRGASDGHEFTLCGGARVNFILYNLFVTLLPLAITVPSFAIRSLPKRP